MFTKFLTKILNIFLAWLIFAANFFASAVFGKDLYKDTGRHFADGAFKCNIILTSKKDLKLSVDCSPKINAAKLKITDKKLAVTDCALITTIPQQPQTPITPDRLIYIVRKPFVFQPGTWLQPGPIRITTQTPGEWVSVISRDPNNPLPNPYSPNDLNALLQNPIPYTMCPQNVIDGMVNGLRMNFHNASIRQINVERDTNRWVTQQTFQ